MPGWLAWTRNDNRVLYNNGVTSSSITVTGATLDAFVSVAAPYDLQGVLATAYVSAANTVIIRLYNATGASVTVASGTWRVRVTKA